MPMKVKIHILIYMDILGNFGTATYMGKKLWNKGHLENSSNLDISIISYLKPLFIKRVLLCNATAYNWMAGE